MPATFPRPGPPGPPGPAGASGGTPFEAIVSVPQSSVTIAHGLGRYPVAVTCYDQSGAVVEVGVRVLDVNTIELTTEAALPFSGRVEVI